MTRSSDRHRTTYVVRCYNPKDDHGVSYLGYDDRDVALLASARRFKSLSAATENQNCSDCRAMPISEAIALDTNMKRRAPMKGGKRCAH